MIFAKAGFTADEIKAALVAPQRRIRFRYELLGRDLNYKRDLKTVSAASIAFDSTASIMRTARFSMREDGDVDFMSARIRPVFGLHMPSDVWAEWPLGVFVLSTPERSAERKNVTREIEAYDLNHVLKSGGIRQRLYYRTGTRYTDAVLNVLALADIRAANVIGAEDTLRADREYAIGTSWLEIINDLLSAINYTPIHPDENGVFQAFRMRDVELADIQYCYSTRRDSVIQSGAKVLSDYFIVPNLFIAYVSNPDAPPMNSVYENADPKSVYSTKNRQLVLEKRELNDMSTQRELDAYVRRWALDATVAPHDITFATGLMPMHGYQDVYQFDHAGLGVNEIYKEMSWDMELIAGGTMNHTARMVIA
jgi:hypothetical protein